jgi:hypothetical protein
MASTSPEYGVSPIERLIRDAAVSLAIKRYIAERQTISVVQTCKRCARGMFRQGYPGLYSCYRPNEGRPETPNREPRSRETASRLSRRPSEGDRSG